MNMKIHTRGWKGSQQIAEGDESDVMFGAVVEIDGCLIERVSRVRVLAAPDEIVEVMVRFVPGTVETIAHTKESWDELWERAPA